MSEEQKIHVVIADDQELVRAGFAMVIGSQPDMAVVGQARDGAEAVALAETLLNSIRTVYQGNAIIAPSATKRLIEKMMDGSFASAATTQPASVTSTSVSMAPAYTDPELDELTDREREVLIEIAHGLSNQEIADKLFISLPTVKTHVAHILSKINARDRVQAVVFAYENHLV